MIILCVLIFALLLEWLLIILAVFFIHVMVLPTVREKIAVARGPRAVYVCAKHVNKVRKGQMAVPHESKCYFCRIGERK